MTSQCRGREWRELLPYVRFEPKLLLLVKVLCVFLGVFVAIGRLLAQLSANGVINGLIIVILTATALMLFVPLLLCELYYLRSLKQSAR